jgi:hypothetical protein
MWPKPFFSELTQNSFFCDKWSPNFWATFVIKKLAEAKSHPICENSLNPVTLVVAKLSCTTDS